MNWRNEWKTLVLLTAGFLLCFFLPVGVGRFDTALMEALHLVKWYAREHVLSCLIPAFFIAGAIAVFVSQGSVMEYLGPRANKVLAYGVASVSGTVLAVCSCTVLPLFSGIYRMGAGIGPASTFLYSGPAINILAIVLTARILGIKLGVARALCAVLFSIVIGVIMSVIFRREEEKRMSAVQTPESDADRPLWQRSLYFLSMIGILVFANWGAPAENTGLFSSIHNAKWPITSVFASALGILLVLWFGLQWWRLAIVALPTAAVALSVGHENPMIPFTVGIVLFSAVSSTGSGEVRDWFASSWGFAKQVLPLLFAGVLIAGLLLGRPESEGLVPSAWVHRALGGNSLSANLFAAVAGAFMYFATLTEVPIVQGLVSNGMGDGPALALLLAGPALSLPNMLVIRSVVGTKKTVVFVVLVIVMAAVSGVTYGTFLA